MQRVLCVSVCEKRKPAGDGGGNDGARRVKETKTRRHTRATPAGRPSTGGRAAREDNVRTCNSGRKRNIIIIIRW